MGRLSRKMSMPSNLYKGSEANTATGVGWSNSTDEGSPTFIILSIDIGPRRATGVKATAWGNAKTYKDRSSPRCSLR